MEYKFEVDDHVSNSIHTRFGTVSYIDHEDDYAPYKVVFSSEPFDYEWFREDELSAVIMQESSDSVNWSSEQSKSKIDTQVVYDDVKVVVELSKPVAVPMEIKPEGRKYDSGKPMYNLIPADALEEVVKVLTYGSLKYNEPAHEENWRKVDHPEQRYFAAMQRHVWATRKGEMNDPESGISHYAHAITSLLFLLQKQIEQNASST